MKRIVTLIFDGAEEMDFVGPWEVLGCVASQKESWETLLVSSYASAVQCENGM